MEINVESFLLQQKIKPELVGKNKKYFWKSIKRIFLIKFKLKIIKFITYLKLN